MEGVGVASALRAGYTAIRSRWAGGFRDAPARRDREAEGKGGLCGPGGARAVSKLPWIRSDHFRRKPIDGSILRSHYEHLYGLITPNGYGIVSPLDIQPERRLTR